MFKKKTSALLITLLIFMQSISGFGFVNQANAAAISSNIIDSVSLAVYDSSNHVVTDNVYEQGSKVQVDYTWSLPNGHGYHDGDTFTFTLPQDFLLVSNVSGSLVSGTGDVGTFAANYLTHQVVMTFNANIGSDDVHGTLTFNTKFDMTKITGSTIQTISVPIKGGTQVFNLNFKPNVASTIGKSGVPQGFNAKNIDWTIDVNKKLESVQNAVVTDPIPIGLSTPVTVAVYDLDINLDGTVVQGALTDVSKYTINTAGGILTVQFNGGSIDKAYRIQYTTPVTDFDKTSFLNKATFSGSNKTPVDASTTVTVQQGTALDKTSSDYNSSTQTIDWTIKYNYNERAIAQTSAYLTDLFNDTQALVGGIVPSSIKVYPVTLDNNGAETLGSALPVSDYTVTAHPAPPSGKTGFKLQFNNAISTAYKLVYQTKAINRVEGPATISNTVTSGLGATDTATRGIDQVIIIKSVNSKDYQAKTVDWKIALNADSESMSSVVFTDNFPNKGLEYRPETLVVKQGATTLNSPADYTVSNVLNDTGFTIQFASTLTAPVTVSYSTYYNNDWISPVGSTTNFLNDATVNWTGTLPNQHIIVHSTFTPRDEVKNNGFKNGSYNAATKQLTWTVGVNYNGKTINNAVVKDLLESKQKLVAGSLKVYEMNIPVNGDPSMGAFVNGSEYDYLVDSANTLILNFKAAITKAYYIVYSTSLDGELIDTNVSNTANVYEAT
ncbi:collagen binding domain-containing protein, partial [Paenibacillus sp. TAF58]